jgi:hypothetical protein
VLLGVALITLTAGGVYFTKVHGERAALGVGSLERPPAQEPPPVKPAVLSRTFEQGGGTSVEI